MKGIKPSRGKVAIRHLEEKEPTTGIIYTKKEHPIFGKGEILSIGHPEITNNGKIKEIDFEVGDYVLYNKQEGWGEYSGVRFIKPEQIVAIVDKETEIG